MVEPPQHLHVRKNALDPAKVSRSNEKLAKYAFSYVTVIKYMHAHPERTYDPGDVPKILCSMLNWPPSSNGLPSGIRQL